uniref:Zinc finger CHCC-type domain-containing protein n=1 Tax=Bombyx mori TaxID=7091 RepID=A0A8R2QQY2_BOMMO|nr:NADH dehydrogenase [ubiquinone] iron-sulfur protein 6, mitochondrial isoform X2 [Bombyx mori]
MNKSLIMTSCSKLKMLRSTPVLCRTLTNKIEDISTHTGQKWDSDDYRLVRFTNAPKQVNPNWAVNLIAEIPPKEVTERVVWCDGGSGPEGHPRVYINLILVIPEVQLSSWLLLC